MKVKVCGLREPENIAVLCQLSLDWMGFIFYDKSPRYVADLACSALDIIPRRIKRVGVFVNSPTSVILERAAFYGLTSVQLHGGEDVHTCSVLRAEGLEVIKAFSVASEKDLTVTDAFAGCCDYFLFDTKTPMFGGSGFSFDWRILASYRGDTPFLLSGGIGPDDAEKLSGFKHERLVGVDLNSRFELAPGVKDTEKVRRFIGSKLFQKNMEDE